MTPRLTLSLLCAASLAIVGCETKSVEPAKNDATRSGAAATPGLQTAKPASSAPTEAEPQAAKPAEQPKPAEAAKPAPTPEVAANPPKEAPVNATPASAPRPDGMIIEDLVVGNGPAVPKGAAVVVHYRGTLKSDGTEFDSSYKRGQPAAFPLANLIKGWQEGIPGMKPGGKRKLTIPYAMAYGEAGRPPVIPPKADLVFEIELVNFLQMEDLKVGDGAECKPGQTVRVYYKGTLASNGQQFDSNVGGEPVEFPLRQLIPGWQYGIPGMKVGGKRKLIVPYQMGYGEQGSPPTIPGKADLVFEIELLGVR